MLREAECDVAVLVAKEGQPSLPTEDAGVLVPFGGAEHDWAALELGAWIASRTGAPLQMLGAAAEGDEATRVTRLLGDASLLVQQYAGISAEPVVAERGREGIVEAASAAGLLVVGLSERWRQEGLGATRSEIARAAPAPRRVRPPRPAPGALAPRGDVTRFTWSLAGGEWRAGRAIKPGRAASPERAQAAGSRARRTTRVAAPGRDWISSCPPVSCDALAHADKAESAGACRRGRSRNRRPPQARRRARSRARPRPARARHAACLATFVSASCTTR